VRSDAPESVKVNLSEYLAERCGASYSLLSKLFTEMKGLSIEKYYILQKVEMVKELLVYNELSVSEIAFRMGYSGVAHLSSQFKSVTGLTPSQFRKVEGKRRSLDAI
jgi:AraC-like DNA-binding protein